MTWRTPKGHPVSSQGNWPAALKLVRDPQRHKLEQVITSAIACRTDADRGDLLASKAGHAFVNALFDLLELDALYDLRGDIEHDLGLAEKEITRADIEEWDADRRQGVKL